MDDDTSSGNLGAADGTPEHSGAGHRRFASTSSLTPTLRAAYAPASVLTMLVLAAAAVWGLEWLAVAGLLLGVANELAAVYSQPALAGLLESAGFRHPVRAMFRSILVAVAVGGAAGGDSTPLILYGLVATCAHAVGIASNALIGWVLARAPVLGMRNIGGELDLPQAFEWSTRNRPASLYVPLAVEWLVVVGLSIAISRSWPAVSSFLVTAVGVGLMGTWALLVLRWARGLTAGGRIAQYEERLLEELRAYDPEVIVYMSAAAGQSGYMLNQWLSALAAMTRRGVLVVREESNVAPIGETPLPIVLARATRDVERMVLPGVKLAIYVANSGRNVQLLREPAIKHVFLNHGDSDKATSANPVSRVYDEVWVAGQAAIDRYEAAGVRIARDRFAVIGRPQVDRLPVGPRASQSPPRVLYAPTWEGIYEEVNYSSLEVAGELIIETILRERPDVAVVFKPHPATGVWRPEMRAACRKVERLLMQSSHADRHLIVDAHQGVTLEDCFALSDVLISDISSVVTDFMQTERPIITSNPLGLQTDEFRAMFPTQQASYILGPDFGAVAALLEEALGADPLADERRAMKRYVLGDLPDGPLRAFSQNVDRICQIAVRDAERVRNSFMFSPSTVARRAGEPTVVRR
jgi:hypothetical protein